jgi:hypothetical protein
MNNEPAKAYSESIVTYSFNTCRINILDDVTRELEEKREESYILREILLAQDHKHQNLNHSSDPYLILSYMKAFDILYWIKTMIS